MKLIVGKHKITIDKEPVNEKEINVNICEFEFDDDISDDYVKEAYFTLGDDSYKQIITNNQCSIPYEVLEQKGQVEIGVVYYKVDEFDETIVRYNPSPVYISTLIGSLKDAKNSEPITPSEMEQYEQALQDGLVLVNSKLDDIDEAITETNNLDIDANKSGTTTIVTITKKDGTTKDVEIDDGIDGINGVDGQDGVSLEYNWQGTQLGIKRDDEQDYSYVDLKGDKGDTGASNVLSIGDVESGDVASATITGTSPSQILNLVLPKGDKGDTGNTGQTGATGNGISKIEKTSTSELVDTYTITYTNGNTDTFSVTNGKDGTNGTNGVGITSIEKTSTSGLIDTYTITYSNGNTSTYTITNGADGQDGQNGSDGVGISSIEKTSTSGLIDTYTITYTSGNPTTYQVTNGANGSNGQDGYTPVRGVDYWTSQDIATIESYCNSLVLGALNESY